MVVVGLDPIGDTITPGVVLSRWIGTYHWLGKLNDIDGRLGPLLTVW